MSDKRAVAALLDTHAKGAEEPLIDEDGNTIDTDYVMARIEEIGEKITAGAISFLAKEYLYLGVYSAAVAVILGLTVDWQEMGRSDEGSVKEAWRATNFPYTATAYLVGSGTSILAGYVGMRIAVYTNTRTTFQCCDTVHAGFLAAFRGGQVLGFCLVGLALLVLQFLIFIFKASWYDATLAAGLKEVTTQTEKDARAMELTRTLFELLAGYGLGGSSVALFGRVGGGIYTKAADVGADLVGKTLKDLKEDDPSNPGTIADNVGDNVGDIAGMGADLFGSLAESTCAALVVSSTSIGLVQTPDALYFPLMVTASGVVASFVSVLFVHLWEVTVDNVQTVLKAQIGISTVLMTAAVLPALWVLPEGGFSFPRQDAAGNPAGKLELTRWTAYACVCFGLWSGMVIGFVTEYYTSNAYRPTLALAEACAHGPAPNIILGLALGYASVVIPILCITATIGYAFSTAGMYGIGLSALGMLGSLPVALSIDGYGPISDNAGGVAEMSGLPASIRDRTDALDAAGNTTAAVGKGFAIGSACLVGLALFGAFITRVGDTSVDILRPAQFAGLLVGAMLPYAFSALTMQAVGDAAADMMSFIIEDYRAREEHKAEQAQLKAANPDHVVEKKEPDYDGCIRISTEASLRKMVAPGALVLGAPLAAGFLFGPPAVAGLLAGAIVSGVQVAISASNTGGAWDNAKKETEKRRSAHKAEVKRAGGDVAAYEEEYRQFEANNDLDNERAKQISEAVLKHRELRERHVAAVVGDTVGDPLKDTSGPAINILIKLSAITSLVFGSYIAGYHAFCPDGDNSRACKK
jgi:H(+)-translocating pyrophosphatase